MPTNTSDNGRPDWIDVPDTQGRHHALRGVLIAICLVSVCLMVFYSVMTPSDVYDIALVPGL
jgi:hypothetical protein